jgi:hypothetical protein
VNLGLAGIAVWILTGDKKVADDVFNFVIKIHFVRLSLL